MTYDESLADRIRAILKGTPGLAEKRMFGGLAFTVNSHIAASAYRDGRLLITCSKADFVDLVSEEGAGPMMRGGKAKNGWVLVESETVKEDESLQRWVKRGLAHCLSKNHG